MTESTRVPYDPELETGLAALLETVGNSLTAETLAAKRAVAAALFPPVETLLEGRRVELVECTIPAASAATDAIRLAVFRRPGTAGAPIVYDIHGGGMVLGDRFSGAQFLIDVVERFGVVCVSPEYRLAPEDPHPAPVEDCYTGLSWVARHGAEIGGDPGRIMVSGASAGGGLAASVALLARDRGGPALVGQMLRAPMLDDRNETVSSHQFASGGLWDRASNITGWSCLLGDVPGGPEVSPYAAPSRALDLAGLPPTFIDVGSAEVFRDEAVDYASRLWAAGVPAELHVWSGGFHGFVLVAQAKVAQASVDVQFNWLSRRLTELSHPI